MGRGFLILSLGLMPMLVLAQRHVDTAWFDQKIKEIHLLEKCDTLINPINDLRSKLESEVDKIHATGRLKRKLEDLEITLLSMGFHYHARTRSTEDSVLYYFDRVAEYRERIGTSFYYKMWLLADYYETKGQYGKALATFDVVLDYYRAAGMEEYEAGVLLHLANVFVNINALELAREILSDLKTRPFFKRDTGYVKTMTNLSEAHLLLREKHTKESLELIKDINLYDKNIPFYLAPHFFGLAPIFLENNMPDEALRAMEVSDALPMRSKIHTAFHSNLVRAQADFLKGNAATAKSFFESTTQHDTEDAYLKLVYLKLKSDYFSLQKRYEEALVQMLAYDALQDSLDFVNSRHLAAVFSYNLNKERELTKLNEANLAKDELINYNKRVYLLVIITVIIALIAIFVLLNTRKTKRQILLQTELTKTKDIAAAKSNFLENLSHEIRTPITAMLGYLNLMRKNTMDTYGILKYSDLAIKSGKGMIDTFNNFLLLLKLEKTTFDSPVEKKSLGRYIKELVLQFEPSATTKGLKIYFRSNLREEPAVTYRFDFLDHILNNLVSNAIKFTPSGKSIYVSTMLEGQDLIIDVKDEGIGIDADEMDLIFNRFYQSDQHQLTGGFGIGLSLVHELVKKLMGTMKVASEKTLGSHFRLQLPLDIENTTLFLNESNREYINLNVAVRESLSSKSQNSLPKALIVDDNMEMVTYLNELLSFDLSCDFAFNGLEGLEKASETKYDIVISDLRMPVMNGIQLKSELNGLPEYVDLPFIIISASNHEMEEDTKLELGISEYMLKPFDGDEILARIKLLLERKTLRNNLFCHEQERMKIHTVYSQLIDDIRKFIDDNLANDLLSTRDLSDHCGYSQSQLNVIVKQKTGLTLSKLILEIRLLRAYELITSGTYQTVSEVTYAIGFKSRPYFYKTFQERFGVKAGDLLKKNAKVMG